MLSLHGGVSGCGGTAGGLWLERGGHLLELATLVTVKACLHVCRYRFGQSIYLKSKM